MRTTRPRTSEALSFTRKVKEIIKKISRGKVATYGQIAAYAGNPRAARQVTWILHSSTSRDKLPWHRVINRQGRISLKPNYGYEIQKALLHKEGIKFNKNDRIDFERYLWTPHFQGSRRL
ncbi:MAG: MGMT family protein [candidate division Zixibacteria bacterium]|nr:MGMT family protein [candidate division Zixibacteria bacterium]